MFPLFSSPLCCVSVEIHSHFDTSRALHKVHFTSPGGSQQDTYGTPVPGTPGRPWAAHSRDDTSQHGSGATTDPRAPTHSTPQRAQPVCRMFLRSYDVGLEGRHCQSSGDEDRIAKPDKRIDVIMWYRLISDLTKTTRRRRFDERD